MRFRLSIASLAVLAVAALGLTADASGSFIEFGPVEQLTTYYNHDLSPDVAGDHVVWSRYLYGTSPTVYAMNLSTGVEWPLGKGGVPRISGNRVVAVGWHVASNANAVKLFDLVAGTEVALSTVWSHLPDVSGDVAVWGETVNGRTEIVAKDVVAGTVTRFVANVPSGGYIRISGDRIVYEAIVDGNRDIYVHDLSDNSNTRLTTDPSVQQYPAISGDLVVWEDYRNGAAWNADIYALDLSTGEQTRVTYHTAYQLRPDVSGYRVVWNDMRSGTNALYLFDLASGIEMPVPNAQAGSPPGPRIGGNRIVFHRQNTGSYLTDVFMVEITAASSPEIALIAHQVDLYVVSGAIHRAGISEAFHALLGQAEAALGSDRDGAAVNLLSAFARLVDRQAGGQIDESAADVLIEMAEAVIDDIE